MVDKLAVATFTIKDAKGKLGKMVWRFMYYGNDYPDAPNDFSQFLPDFMQELDNYLQGQIVNCSVSIDVPLPTGIKLVPNPDADVNETVVTAWRTEQFFYSKVSIPTVGDEWLNADRSLDQEVLDFLYVWFENATELPAGGWVIDTVDSRGVSYDEQNPTGKRVFKRN